MNMPAIITPALGMLLVTASAGADSDAFWENMRPMCGNAYEGGMTHVRGEPVSADHWPQVLHVHRCEDDRIPGVNVGSPSSTVRFEFDLTRMVEAPSAWRWEEWP